MKIKCDISMSVWVIIDWVCSLPSYKYECDECDEKNEDFLKWAENDKDNLFELLHKEAYYLNLWQLEK